MCYEILIQLNITDINSYSNAKLINILLPRLALAFMTRLMSSYKDKNVVFNTTNKINQ